MIGPIAGQAGWARPLAQTVVQSAPSDAGRQIVARSPANLTFANLAVLPEKNLVAMVSATELQDPQTISEMTLLALCQQADIPWLLQGEILAVPNADHRSPRTPAIANASPDPQTTSDPQTTLSLAHRPEDQRLSLSWQLYRVDTGQAVGARAFTVTVDSAVERFPDLADLTDDPHRLLTVAAARQTWELVVPCLQTQTVSLAATRWLPASQDIRRGNALATVGRWDQAASVWQAVTQGHPRQHAAWHNLALASVAAQDFQTARRNINTALQLRDSRSYRQTSAWIEMRQRAYHQAFSLCDPPEGWTITRGSNLR